MKEFVRYAFASGLALVVDVSILYIFTEWLDIHYLISATAGFCLGAIVAYFLSIHWAFSHRSIEDQKSEFTIFVSIGMIGLIINNVLIWSLTDLLGFHYLQSKIFTTGVVFLFNYTMRQRLLFTPRTSNEIV